MEVDTPALVAVGAVVVVACLVDLIWTTVSVSAGKGPITQTVARVLWTAGSPAQPSHRWLRILGVITATSVPATWIALLIAGFSIMFMADAEAVVTASDLTPVGWLGRVAYAIGAIAGAGASLVAGTPTWELVNDVAAVSGLLFVTMSLTYLLQTVNAVAAERSAASTIAGLGPSPGAAVAAALGGDAAGTMPLHLTGITSDISLAAQHHLALPVQQYFHSGRTTTSAAVNVARFDEILTLLHLAAPEGWEPVVRSGHSAVDAFMETIALADEGVDVPPPPPLGPLHDVGARVDDDGLAAELAAHDDRRRRLHAFVIQEGWTWDDVLAR